MCEAMRKQYLWFLPFYLLCETRLFYLHQWTAIVTLFPTIFQIEIHSEENILNNCHNGSHVGNVKWMESNEILEKIQVIVHPAYAQCKLWNVYNVVDLIDNDNAKISTMNQHSRKTCSAITFIISFWMPLDVCLSPFHFMEAFRKGLSSAGK